MAATMAVVAHERAAAAVAASTTVGPLPQPSLSSHSRGSSLLCFFQMMARVCGGGDGGFPSPLIEPKMDREGKGPT